MPVSKHTRKGQVRKHVQRRINKRHARHVVIKK